MDPGRQIYLSKNKKNFGQKWFFEQKNKKKFPEKKFFQKKLKKKQTKFFEKTFSQLPAHILSKFQIVQTTASHCHNVV